MTQDEIIDMAKQAGISFQSHVGITGRVNVTTTGSQPTSKIAKLIELAKASEREACAKLCDELAEDRWNLYKGRSPYGGREEGRAHPQTQGECIGAEGCAAAIRARNESPKGGSA